MESTTCFPHPTLGLKIRNAYFARSKLVCSQHPSPTWISLKTLKFVHSLIEKAIILYVQGCEPEVTMLK